MTYAITQLDMIDTAPAVCIPHQSSPYAADESDLGEDERSDLHSCIDLMEARVWSGHQKHAVRALAHDIDVATAEATGEADCRNKGTDGGVEWFEPCMTVDGFKAVIIYDFTADDLADADDDSSNLDWSPDHIDRVELTE